MTEDQLERLCSYLDSKTVSQFLKKFGLKEMELIVITPILPMLTGWLRTELVRISHLDADRRSEVGYSIIQVIAYIFSLDISVPMPEYQWRKIIESWLLGAPDTSSSQDGSRPELNGSLGDSQP
jgi:hypothetical protein